MPQLTVKTHSQTELIDITSQIQDVLDRERYESGVCMIFVPHTTAGVTINECADPSVKSDIIMVLNQTVPWKAAYKHLEGNSPAHIKASLMGASQVVAVERGRLVLGTWQGIFFCEFDGPRTRKVQITFLPRDPSTRGADR
jgi:secondary thiamine-phosphate synthase enzyme